MYIYNKSHNSTCYKLVLCDTWNWSHDNDTISGMEYCDTGSSCETVVPKPVERAVKFSPNPAMF